MTERDQILSELYAEFYSNTAVTANGSVAERYLHRSLERRFGATDHFAAVLEVGGNRGEHVPYVRHSYESYLLTDLREPVLPPELSSNPKISVAAWDAAAMPCPDQSFDRVVATCLLHHVPSPLQVGRELRRVCRPGGVISILVPTDPGLAYRLAQAVTSDRMARKQGAYDRWRLMHALDHPNHFRSIRTQLRSVFAADRVDCEWYPLRVPSVDLNLFTVWHVELRRS